MRLFQLSLVLLVGIVSTLAIPSPQQNDTAAPAPKSRNVLDDPDRKSCHWTNDGSGSYYLDGEKEVPQKGTTYDLSPSKNVTTPQKTSQSEELAPTSTPKFKNVFEDPDRNKCIWAHGGDRFYLGGNGSSLAKLFDWEGFHSPPNFDPEHPNGYDGEEYSSPYLYNHVEWDLPDNMPQPPEGWNGSESTLGYPLPEKGTDLYKYFLCYPEIPAKASYYIKNSTEWNIKQDPDRRRCFTWGWSYNFDEFYRYDGDRYSMTMDNSTLPGGFPKLYKFYVNRRGDIYTRTIESSPEYQRPTQAWDGRKETLGFPVPAKGTAHYNMLLCWPYDLQLKSNDQV